MTAPVSNNIQDSFLNQARKERETVLLTTTNGFKIKCRIKAFDRFSILIESGDYEQIIFKHAIASISVKREFSNKMKLQKTKPGEKEEKTEEPSE